MGFSADKKARIGILGASGYTGADLVRLIHRHPAMEIVLMTAERKAGQPIDSVFPHLAGLGLPDMIKVSEVEWPAVELDGMFCALPHATSQEVIQGMMHATDHSLLDELIIESDSDRSSQIRGNIKIVDLSADFRLRDAKTYTEWYGRDHQATNIQSRAVYGLTEMYREQIASAKLVACPGCYPTAALLALMPLLSAGVITSEDIIIDAKSGVTGAGRSLKEANLFSEVSDAMHPYGVANHRHMPEIEQELSLASGEPVRISFTPHLVPMNRGELETIYVKLAGDQSAADIRAAWQDAFADEPFIRILSEGLAPATRMVRGSNQCVLNVWDDRQSGRAIIVAAIDNLVKGSSGQALQNMNLMLGLPEVLGLEQIAMFP